MKSNYVRSKSETRQISREAAKEEIKKQMETVCPKCQARMERQTIAVMLFALHTVYGFGTKRLRMVYDFACNFGRVIHEDGDKYDEYVKYMKDEYGIDLEED